MAGYDLLVERDAIDFVESLDEKSERICKENLKKLADQPYPGRGKGDKEKLVVDGETVYRLHIGRTFTAFYEIVEDENVVRVLEVLPIDEAHDRYGY
jgi:mRNA-degrading endonuclease RelE of RelBE toxin-antitoxin system